MKKIQHGSQDSSKRKHRIAVAQSAAQRLLTQDEVHLNWFERRWFNSAAVGNRRAMMERLEQRIQDALPKGYIVKVTYTYSSPYTGILKSCVITRRII